MEELIHKMVALRTMYIQEKGMDAGEVDNILKGTIGTPAIRRKALHYKRSLWTAVCLYVVFPVAMAVIFTPLLVPELRSIALDYVHGTYCLVENNFVIGEISRPLFDCDVCRDLREAPIAIGISKAEFRDKYAYSSVPVLIKEATRDWTALDTFSFQYFKKIYRDADERRAEERKEGNQQTADTEEGSADNECQFFGYKTEFTGLKEALNMAKERSEYLPGEEPWYFGWSNCNPDVTSELRSHYSRPYFIPDDSESSEIDWLFMGGPGVGAGMHLDSVRRPSWQAQIAGSKTWILEPVVECQSVCHAFNITMETGDIIVVDTNQWYHSTVILPGNISISIGSEYD